MSMAVVALALLSSCSTTIVTSSAPDIKPTVRPVIADLEVQQKKISATFTSNDKRVFRMGRGGESEIVRNAVFQALQTAKADVLIGMQYQITEVRNAFGRLKSKTVVVNGYPGVYTNIRSLPNNEIKAQELKADTPYLITEKQGDGDTKVYTIITTQNNELTLDLEKADKETVILTNDKEDGKKDSFFQRLFKK